SGFVVGLWLELLFSRHPPYGAARYPEAGPAALIAGATVASAGGASTAVLSGSVLVGWTVGWIGMHSIGVARRLNARLVADPGALGGSPTELGRRHLACLGFDATRAAALVATLLVPAVLGVRVLAELDVGTAASASSTSLLAAVGIAGLTGVGARALGARRNGWPIVLGGAGVGAVLAWWLG
ncbi:MAG: hypothetical protein MJB57_13690, partial [Gemmatimonadetes bacterium]|nr:hypothetical protein [Gemmatimonadota bacterium]